MAVQLQLRRGLAAQWTSANTLLAQGELGLETDTGKLKIGDGSTAWTSLAYYTAGAAAVTSVNGYTGTVVLTASDISGLGTIATQAANNITITGGSITGITDLAVADGGTGASTASGARTNLGLVIGTDVLAPNGSAASLTSFPTLNQNTTGTASNVTGTVAVVNGGTGATTASGARTNLGLVIGTDVLSPTGSAASLTSFPTFNQNTTGTASNVTGTVAIANGGTGATTAGAALTALGAYAASNPSGYTSNTGTVTSVAALTLGTTGTDVSSTVANGTTTPVITLNIPTASATNRGALSAADWTTFNSKGSGTVTSVGMTTPTGLTVTGSPITSSGTLALSMTAGYAIPTTSSQTNWDSAYTQRLQWDGGSTNLVASTGRTSLGVTATGADTTYAYRANNLSDLANATTARSNLGLGSAATLTAGSANGVATLDSGGKVPSGQLPAIAITDTFVVVSQSAMLALTAETGDVAVRTDLNKSFILTASPASTLANWQELLTPTDAVTSVAGRTGAVTLSTSDISGLGTIATQAANNVNITGGSITGITDLAVADGGTGSSTASGARTNLGLVIGTDVLAPNGSAASLTSFPTFNQNTTGTASNVTGTVAIANGGTGATTAGAALTALGAYAASNPSGYTSNTGTVTSVALTTPTGLSVLGSPVTTSGTLALSMTAGYAIPTTASQTNWDTAYGWGNHASAGYLTTSTAASTYAPLTGTGTSGTWGISITGNAATATNVAYSGLTGTVPTWNQNTTGTAANVTGTVAVANGGTGATTTSGARTNLGLVIGTDVLAPNGSAASLTSFPTFNQNTTGTASNVTGTVAIANGGTGQTTASAGFNALSPVTSTGDIIIGNGTNSSTRLGIGTNGYVLTSNGTTATWAAASGGGSALTVKDEGTTLSSAVTSFDFVGAGVVATNTGGAVTVTVAGGGGGGGTSSPIPKLQSWSIGGF
jgi:hypothetical protein